MIALLLTLSAQATSLADISNDQRLLVECEHQVAPATAKDEYAEIASIWKQCLEQARNQGLDGAAREAAGRHALAVIQRDYGSLKESASSTYSEIVLATAAQGKGLHITHEILNAHWHTILADPSARSRLEGMLSIAIRWLPTTGMDPDLQASFEDKVARYVADLGLKVPSSSSADAAKADIMVMVQAMTRELEPELADERGTIHVIEASLNSQAVRYKTREKRAPPVEVSRKANGSRPKEALDEAVEQTCQAFAEDLLLQLVKVAYNNYRIPAP
jgi:hypothetical protein